MLSDKMPMVARETKAPPMSRLWTMLLYGMLGTAFVLRMMNITGESLWRDEVDTIRFAFMPLEQLIGNLARTGFNGPVYTLLVRGWLSLGGINDFSLRYLSLLFGMLQVALVAVFTYRLFGRTTALVATWLTMLAPVLIWYSGEGKMYTLQPALLLLALYALRRAVDRDPTGTIAPEHGLTTRLKQKLNAWWMVFVGAVSLAYYVHLLSPLFIAVAVVCCLLWWPLTRLHWRGALISFGLCTVPYIPLAVWQFPALIKGVPTGHESVSLVTLVGNLFSNWSMGLNGQQLALPAGTLPTVAMAVFIAALCVGFYTISSRPAIKRTTIENPSRLAQFGLSPFASALAVLAWLLLPMLMVYLISLRAPIFEPRYLLWSAPAFYVLCSVGVSWMIKKARYAGLAYLIMLSLLAVWGIVAQIVSPIRPDIRNAARYAAQAMSPDDLFVFQIPYTRYGFLYYMPYYAEGLPREATPHRSDGLISILGLRNRFIDAPYTNRQATPDDVIAYLRPIIGNTQRVWFIETEAEMWDERGMVRAWFDKHMIAAEHVDYQDVSITLYEKP